jgi:hypothetical protein
MAKQYEWDSIGIYPTPPRSPLLDRVGDSFACVRHGGGHSAINGRLGYEGVIVVEDDHMTFSIWRCGHRHKPDEQGRVKALACARQELERREARRDSQGGLGHGGEAEGEIEIRIEEKCGQDQD